MKLQNDFYLNWLKIINPKLKTNKEKAESNKKIRHIKKKQKTFYKQLVKLNFGIKKKKFNFIVFKDFSIDFEQELNTQDFHIEINLKHE